MRFVGIIEIVRWLSEMMGMNWIKAPNFFCDFFT